MQWADAGGALAEYTVATEEQTSLKPAGLSFAGLYLFASSEKAHTIWHCLLRK